MAFAYRVRVPQRPWVLANPKGAKRLSFSFFFQELLAGNQASDVRNRHSQGPGLVVLGFCPALRVMRARFLCLSAGPHHAPEPGPALERELPPFVAFPFWSLPS